MTEKLLLYGGAIQQAGAVRQKAEQRATASDFMEMEKERGISIRWGYHYLRCSRPGRIAMRVNDIVSSSPFDNRAELTQLSPSSSVLY